MVGKGKEGGRGPWVLRLEVKGSPGAPSALPEAATSLGGFVSTMTTGADAEEPLSNTGSPRASKTLLSHTRGWSQK